MDDDIERVVAAVKQIGETLDIHTELLRHLIQLAEPTPDGGGGLVEFMGRIERMLMVQNAMLRQLVDRSRAEVSGREN
jgi:hypothetical protein